MDPVSGFGLAVNVLAVIDFSKTLLEVYGQVRDAGSSTATQDIISITRSLQASNEKVNSEAWIAGKNEAFKGLINESQTLSKDLIGRAENLSIGKSSTLVEKMKLTAREMWSNSEIKQTQARLQAIRGQLLYDIVVPMAEKINIVPDTSALDTQTRTLLKAITAGQDINKAMEERLHSFHQEYTAAQQDQHFEVVSLLHDIRDGQLRNSSSRHGDVVKDMEAKNTLEKIMYFLSFDQEKDRHDDIDSAHKGTFEWIYNEPPSAAFRATWSNFPKWLRNDAGIYWLSGKAGSGKSTLMKLLTTDGRLRDSLLEWGGGGRLLVLSFYFWNPGTPLQKSLEGLFRSVLLQALQECPELGQRLFPDRFGHFVQWGQFPTMHQLKRAFTYLTTEDIRDASGLPLKLALLIDGLDEFDAGAMNHSELSEIFTSAAGESSSFKAILSSRPENAFEHAFRDCPKLRLHHLTRHDVVRYVNDKLHDHPRMQTLMSQSAKHAEALVSEIVEAAQGVFLWVRLVVRSLLEGLQNHDEIDILTQRLHELPTDLEELFRYMLQRVPGRYERGMSKMFQLLRTHSEILSGRSNTRMMVNVVPLTALGLRFGLLDERTVLQAKTGQFTIEEASEEVLSIEAKMRSHCAGLIELSTVDDDVPGEGLSNRAPRSSLGESSNRSDSSPIGRLDSRNDPKVRFIHRSVPEYLWKEEVWNNIRAQTDHLGFHPLSATLRSLVMQAKKSRVKRSNFRFGVRESGAGQISAWDLVGAVLEVAHRLEEAQGTAQMDLLEALETALTTRCGSDWWDTYFEDYTRPAKWHDNFFAFTIRYGLWRYVQARLQTRGPETMKKSGRPLLDYACRPEPRYQVWLRATDVRIVEALLQNGADPNLKFNGFTPWQNAWYTAWPDAGTRPSRLLLVFEVLLAYGADPNAYIEYPVRLSKRQWQKRRCTVLRKAQSDRPHFAKSVQTLTGKKKKEEKELDEIMTISDALITMLEKRGGKAKEWRQTNGVFVRYKTSHGMIWGADRLRVQEKCIIL